MRTLAELPHPECKITIFGMNQKYIIKFEQGSLEQTYKIAEADILNGVNGVFEILDEDFISKVLENFSNMRTAFIDTYNKYN
ncbi:MULTISPECIES: hypothetical protein [Sphingobacterium]|uniref:Uncharacterized protein n=1 Tax=Sphingobacterium litopenaei TaxID=2763500 RepID=A0ABR7YG99_9SPHI|nr:MULTISPECIES: hypothetical protein [Sphingobacterium]MBD1430264.1 hypothetical protein [Sphingobacterium litopenaei]NGM71828.1 hypothetical protein [Sphingobacterium sp. SGL-16]